jgi:hypothetical protein
MGLECKYFNKIKKNPKKLSKLPAQTLACAGGTQPKNKKTKKTKKKTRKKNRFFFKVAIIDPVR